MTKIIREKENKRMGVEIKGKRTRRAAFSYSLAILFSALGAAQGAKMCVLNTAPHYEYNKDSFLWVAGSGCPSGLGTWDTGNTRVLESMTVSNQSTTCSGANGWWGIAICTDFYGGVNGVSNNGIAFNSGGNWPYSAGMNQSSDNPDDSLVRHCLCQMTGKKVNGIVSSHSGYMFYSTGEKSGATCGNLCANRCGYMAIRNFPKMEAFAIK